MTVRALVADPDAPAKIRLTEVDEPSPGPRELVVEAHHVSVNRGDLNDARSGRVHVGGVLGSDVAGVVVQAAADGDGPPVGARVVALTSGAFAERVAVDIDAVAEVPDGVDLAEAAAIPVAGLAAIQALRAATQQTPVRSARVLVTGASGGVGRFAVQLAAYGGAHVIALASNAERAAELADLGAEQVVVDITQVDEPVDLVLDNVGGRQLVAAWGLLAPGGNMQCIGWSSGETAAFPPYSTVGAAKSLTSFLITAPIGPDLINLLRLVKEGSLRVKISWRGPLSRIAEAAEAMLSRRANGKVVLDLAPSQRG
jgi:NADPH:quinone reductase-like Zn-dependent oxidoreductase